MGSGLFLTLLQNETSNQEGIADSRQLAPKCSEFLAAGICFVEAVAVVAKEQLVDDVRRGVPGLVLRCKVQLPQQFSFVSVVN